MQESKALKMLGELLETESEKNAKKNTNSVELNFANLTSYKNIL